MTRRSGRAWLPLALLLPAVGVLLALGGGAQALGGRAGWAAAAGAVVAALVGVGGLLAFGRYAENAGPDHVGLGTRRLAGDLVEGFVGGSLLMTAVIASFALLGWYTVGERHSFTAWPLLAFLFGAVFEEAVFRGLLFRVIEAYAGSWIALLASAGMFGLAHLANPDATLATAGAIALEAGILLGGVFMLTRSLWTAVGVHCAWNTFEAYVYGTPVSGQEIGASLFTGRLDGPVRWTGGEFGPEAGLVAMLVCLPVAAAVLIAAVHRGRVRWPGWFRRTPVQTPPPPAAVASPPGATA